MSACKPRSFRGAHFPRPRRAFSLVEILVVIVILAVMSTVALYSYAEYREQLVTDTAASAVQKTLLFAKNRAISYRTPHQVVFDLDNNTFWVDELDSSSTVVRPKVAEEEGTGDFVELHIVKIGSTEFGSGRRMVRFEPDGTNPLVVVEVRRTAADVLDLTSYVSVRMFPTSSDAQVVDGRGLL